MYTQTSSVILIFSGILLLMFACNTQESHNSKVIRDSIYKEDSLITVYIMEKLKQSHPDSTRKDSNQTAESNRGAKDLFPLLTPEARKKPESKPVEDSCTDKTVTKELIPTATQPVTTPPKSPTVSPKNTGIPKPKSTLNEPKTVTAVKPVITQPQSATPTPAVKQETAKPAADPQAPKPESPSPTKEEVK